MAAIRVNCPACRSELEVDAAHEGKEIECGNCLEVFLAQSPTADRSVLVHTVPSEKKRDKPASRKNRRDDDDHPRSRRRRDDEDDDYAPPPPRRTSGPGDGFAVVSLILGLLALPIVCCWPVSLCLGLAAVVTGNFGLASKNHKVPAVIGMVLGLIALCLAGLIAATGFGAALFGGRGR